MFPLRTGAFIIVSQLDVVEKALLKRTAWRMALLVMKLLNFFSFG